MSSTRFKKGQIPWNKGKKIPEKSGDKHPNWKGKSVCPDCNGRKTSSADRCLKCKAVYMSGSNTYQYKGGKPNCIDCGKKTTQYSSIRCLSCYRNYKKVSVGEKSVCWKGRISISCKGCNKKIQVRVNSKKRFCTKKCFGSFYRATNNPRYKGLASYARIVKAVRQLVEYKSYRTNIFKRDGFVCNFPNCDSRSVYVEAHHINKLSNIIKNENIKNSIEATKCSKMWDLNNCITLCKDCHNHIQGNENQYINLFNLINKSKLSLTK